MDDVKNVPPFRTSPYRCVSSSLLHGVIGPSVAGTARSGPAPQKGIAGGAIANADASDPEIVLQLAMTLSGPPTMKHPGHRPKDPYTKLMRSPSAVMTRSRSSHDSGAAGRFIAPPARKDSSGHASCAPSQVTSNDAGSTVSAYGTGTVTPVTSIVAHERCPTTPEAWVSAVSSSSTAGMTL